MILESLHQAARVIGEKTGRARHDVAAVLGSGLGDYPQDLEDAIAVPYETIPGFPVPHVEGHAGTAYSARFGDNQVLLLSGRAHAYEGHSLETVVFAVRAAILSGCKTVLLTNAAGGCGDGMAPGDLVLISDHINLTGRNPLVGANDERLGTRFPDMSSVYDGDLRAAAHAAAARSGTTLGEGVYAWFLGPSYETPAEVQMAKRLGADMVGMSTVPEAIAARHMGARVIGISLVTNLAAGISPEPLSHQEVTETAAAARLRFSGILDELLPQI